MLMPRNMNCVVLAVSMLGQDHIGSFKKMNPSFKLHKIPWIISTSSVPDNLLIRPYKDNRLLFSVLHSVLGYISLSGVIIINILGYCIIFREKIEMMGAL